MATIDSQITLVRYDLRDEYSTQYVNAYLVGVFNRVINALSGFLASIKSDWVMDDTTLTVSSGNNYVALPSDFASPIIVEISDSEIAQSNPREVLLLQQDSPSWPPSYYAIHKTNIIFDASATADTSVYLQYNQNPTELALGSSMPYGDQYNDVIRSAVCAVAKDRNERDLTGDIAIMQLFRDAAFNRTVRRIKPKTYNLGF